MWPSGSAPTDWIQWLVPWLQALLFSGLILCGKKKNVPKTTGETASMRTIIAPPPPPPAPFLKAESEKKKSKVEKSKSKVEKTKPSPPPTKASTAKEKESERLEVDPTELRWTSDGGEEKFKATNTTDKRLAYKVKTSNPEVFSVLPNVGFISGHETVTVAVCRAAAPMKEDTLMIVSCEATAEDKEPQDVFKRKPDQQQSTMITMVQK